MYLNECDMCIQCSLGLADAIVDLVETGTTMKAVSSLDTNSRSAVSGSLIYSSPFMLPQAGLEIVSVIMQTETVLIANTNSKHKSLIALINARIKGYLSANAFQMIQYNVKRVDLGKAVTVTPGKRSPCVIPLGESCTPHDG